VVVELLVAENDVVAAAERVPLSMPPQSHSVFVALRQDRDSHLKTS